MEEVHRRPEERDISGGATRINTDPVDREQRRRPKHTSTPVGDEQLNRRRRLRRVAVSLHLRRQLADRLLQRSAPQPIGGPNCAVSGTCWALKIFSS
jgi:hypothetical protein